MAETTWYEAAWKHMTHILAEEYTDLDIGKTIDDNYPFGKRCGWPYKAWLNARRDFFRKHNIQLRRAKKPGPDLFN
jgi:hypothetical protein